MDVADAEPDGGRANVLEIFSGETKNRCKSRLFARLFVSLQKERKRKCNMRVASLNSAQLMILESFAGVETQEEMDELMDLLRTYYARKLDKELERLWNDGTFNQEKLDELRGQHLRTH